MTHFQRPFQIIIVEDEALLVMDLEAMLTDEGHEVIGEAASLAEVEALECATIPTLAFVDIQLAHNSSGLAVCQFVQKRWPGIAVVFVTANPKLIPEDFSGAHGVIPKPFSRSGLLSAMRFLEEGLIDPPPISSMPPSFIASPRIAEAWMTR